MRLREFAPSPDHSGGGDGDFRMSWDQILDMYRQILTHTLGWKLTAGPGRSAQFIRGRAVFSVDQGLSPTIFRYRLEDTGQVIMSGFAHTLYSSVQSVLDRVKQRGIMDEATGDAKFDAMMGRIADPVAALKQDRDYEVRLEDYVFQFMDRFVDQMDKLGIEFKVDGRANPTPKPVEPPFDAPAAQKGQYLKAWMSWARDYEANEVVNPKFVQAYEKLSSQAVKDFVKREKLDPTNRQVLELVKKDFDENADQTPEVAGFLGAFMQGFTTLRPGEIDIMSKAGMFKKPSDNNE